MVVFNPSKREIGAKIVYYGPAACGKTTNLQYVHRKLNPAQRGELVSLATKDDRTLFFDFLPLDLGSVRGFKTRFHLYTVPGQVYYVSTRRAVLTGVDGVIFVADSQESKMAENIESLEDLEKNLSYYGKKVDEVPMILQYNKRDMPNLSTVEALNEKLNKRRLPFVEASAFNGRGVMEALTMITRAVLENLEDSSRKPKIPLRRRPGAYAPEDASAAKMPPPLPPVAPAHLGPPTLPGTVAPARFVPLLETRVNDPFAEADAPAFGPGAGDKSDLELEPGGADDLLQFGDDGDQVGAEVDDDLDLAEFEEEGSGEDIQPLELGSEAVETQETLELAGEDGDVRNQDEVLELDGLEESPSGQLTDDALAGSDEVALEIGIPADELALDVEEQAAYPGEEGGLTVGSELADEADDAESLFEEDLLELEEPALSEFAASEGNGENGIEIVHCGEPQKVSRSAVQVPLVLRLNRSNDRVSFTLTVQLTELLKRNG